MRGGEGVATDAAGGIGGERRGGALEGRSDPGSEAGTWEWGGAERPPFGSRRSHGGPNPCRSLKGWSISSIITQTPQLLREMEPSSGNRLLESLGVAENRKPHLSSFGRQCISMSQDNFCFILLFLFLP